MYDSPVERAITRWAAADVEFGGRTIAGDFVIAVIGSANRDRAQFRDPDTLDLGREDVKMSDSSRGPHYCASSAARPSGSRYRAHEAVRRLRNLRLEITEEDLYRRPIPIFRSLASLPVSWD